MLTTNSAPRFDLHAKRIFLTYAQCGSTTKEELRDFLINDRGAQWFIIGYETHKDGGKHLHAYIEYTEQKRVRDATYFDFNNVHPNIQGVKRPKECQEYCVKEGDFIANMEIARGKRTYGELIKGASTSEEFLVAVEEAFPRDMVLHFDRITNFANHKWPKYNNEYTTEFSQFVVPEDLVAWMEDNIQGR